MKCKDCHCCKLVTIERWSGEKQKSIKAEEYQCWGVRDIFTIKDINKECTEYELKKEKFSLPKDKELKILKAFIVEKGLEGELLDYYRETEENT